MIYYGSRSQGDQLFAVNLQTFQSRQITHLPFRFGGEIIAPKSKTAYVQSRDSVFKINLENGKAELIYVFPMIFMGILHQ